MALEELLEQGGFETEGFEGIYVVKRKRFYARIGEEEPYENGSADSGYNLREINYELPIPPKLKAASRWIIQEALLPTDELVGQAVGNIFHFSFEGEEVDNRFRIQTHFLTPKDMMPDVGDKKLARTMEVVYKTVAFNYKLIFGNLAITH